VYDPEKNPYGFIQYQIRDNELYSEFDKLMAQGYQLFFTQTNIYYEDIGVNSFYLHIIFMWKKKGQKLIRIRGD
jgi:hypothetical protein